MKEFKTISFVGSVPTEFDKEVELHIRQGWKLQGGVCVVPESGTLGYYRYSISLTRIPR